MSGVTILEQQHVFVTLLDFRDGALLHGVIPNLNICTNLGSVDERTGNVIQRKAWDTNQPSSDTI